MNIKLQNISFDEYWLRYLAAHTNPATRACHYFGTVFGLFVGLGLSIFVKWWLILIIGPIGYGIAFASHPLIQGNLPFAHRPLWSLASDLRMLWLAVIGKLDVQLNRIR